MSAKRRRGSLKPRNDVIVAAMFQALTHMRIIAQRKHGDDTAFVVAHNNGILKGVDHYETMAVHYISTLPRDAFAVITAAQLAMLTRALESDAQSTREIIRTHLKPAPAPTAPIVWN